MSIISKNFNLSKLNLRTRGKNIEVIEEAIVQAQGIKLEYEYNALCCATEVMIITIVTFVFFITKYFNCE